MILSDKVLVELMRPHLFVQAFDTMYDFKQWVRLGEIEDIDWLRNLFEEYELYEYCQACVEVIREKDTFGIWSRST